MDAKQSDLRRAYRKLFLKFHPDKNNKDPSIHADAIIAFQDIVAAYEVLGTPDKRAAFDEAAGNGEAADFECGTRRASTSMTQTSMPATNSSPL